MRQRLLSLLESDLHPSQLKQIHAVIVKEDPFLTPFFLKHLLNPGTASYACQVFDRVTCPDALLTNSVISSFTKLSLHWHALETFFSAHRKETQVAFFSVPAVFKACALLPALLEGKQVHSFVVRSGFESNSFIQTALIDFYSKNDDLVSARRVFNFVESKDPVTYNCLISGYSRSGDSIAARHLFDQMGERTIVSWNSMISCYAHCGNVMEGLRLFERMQLGNIEPNEITLVTVLSTCAKLGDLQTGLKIKKLIDSHPQCNKLVVRTAVMEMLLKGGAVDEARREFDEMDHRDVVAWSAMIAGYAQNGKAEEALEMFQKMMAEKVKPNEVTLVSVLSACGQLGSVEVGERIGTYVEDQGFASSVYVNSALLDMYSKCGNIVKARIIFNMMHHKDVVTWNSMISGLAYCGFASDAVAFYKKMVEDNAQPNDLTFIGLLTACTHAGLIDQGLQFYNSMKLTHKIVPKVEHCACIVDLLCRSGRLAEAYNFICKMETEPNIVIWGTLLSACRVHSNVQLAEHSMEKLVVLEPDNSANYVLLANIYANAGRWRDALKMRDLMKSKKVQKTAAYSWVELDNTVHKFLVQDISHPKSEEIYDTIDSLGLLLNWYTSATDSDIRLF